MIKLKNIFRGIILSVLLLPLITSAKVTLENVDEVVKKLSPDLENVTLNMAKPTTPEEGDLNVNVYISNLIASDEYYTFGYYDTNTKKIILTINSMDYMPAHEEWDSQTHTQVQIDQKGWIKQYILTPTFNAPQSNNVASSIVSKLKKFDFTDLSTSYILEDLSLVNYYLTSNKSELTYPLAPARALKYTEVNKLYNGLDLTYFLTIGAGSQDESLMYESAFGPFGIFQNGSLVASTEAGIYLKRVIYIPSDTANNTDAYIAAAKKRIKDYVGENATIDIKLGGTLASLPEDSEDTEMPITGHDGNYYLITIGKRTYKFYLVKASADKLVNPTYDNKDTNTNIEVTSSDASVPLDTTLIVKNVNDASIKDKINTDNYVSYDISLYSEAKEASITKLANGKFLVKVPIPANLKGKTLTIYYIPTTGEIEEHTVTVSEDSDYATFETDHFSVYTLAEKVTKEETNETVEETKETTETKEETKKIKNPQTGDKVLIYVVTSLLSLMFIVASILVIKRV